MADKYDSPAGNIDTVQVIESVEDVEFETLLDKEGFPETYKKALRYLHKIHPNWTFQAMQTNLDFTYVVNCEKGTGATQYSALYEKDENGNIDGDAQCDKKFASLLRICPRHTTGHEIVGKGNQQKQNEIGTAQLVVEIEREKSRE